MTMPFKVDTVRFQIHQGQGMARVAMGLWCSLLIPLLGTPALMAAESTTMPSAQAENDLTAGLEGVSGVRAGMTLEELSTAGGAALADGRLADARKIFLALAARDRTNLRILGNLGFAYERSASEVRGDGSDAKAVAQAEGFIDQAVDVYLEAAGVAHKTNQWATAEQMYSRVLMHRPARGEALLGLARVYAATDRPLQAIDRYKEYQNNPGGTDDPTAYLELARLYLVGDHWRQALDALNRAQKLNEKSADIDMVLAQAYRKGDRLSQALESATTATQKAPRQAKYRNLLAELQIDQGDAEQASIEARRAIEFTREAMEAAGGDLPLMGELSKYYATYMRALRGLLTEGKASPQVRADLARAIQEKAAVDRDLALSEALTLLQEAPDTSRTDPRLLEQMARLEFELVRFEAAAKTCQQLLKVDPRNETATQILKEIKAASSR